MNFVGCSGVAGPCGTPLSGGKLYFFYVGTVNTPQNSYQDTALSIANPSPLVLDSNGRVPPFYLANGAVHVRLTDSTGVVMFDYPNMLVIGASGGGGGGAGVDPTTIASTGDTKFRPTSETLTGWVFLNGLTIGSATSGASGRANADTQNLFVYLWTNCANAHCAVVGGRGATGIADFQANKQLTLLDWRGQLPIGLDDMGNSAAGRLLASQVTSGGGDTVTTPNATGGASTTTVAQANLPNVNFTVTDPGHTHTVPYNSGSTSGSGGGSVPVGPGPINTGSSTTGISVNSGGSGTAANTVSPFILGSWYIKL